MIAPLLRATAFALVAAAATAAGSADPAPVPTPAPLPTLPPAANPLVERGVGLLVRSLGAAREREANAAHGTVSYLRKFDLQIRTGRNAYRTIRLHQGTVINPRGVSLAPGTTVTVSGRAQPDGTLDADLVVVEQ